MLQTLRLNALSLTCTSKVPPIVQPLLDASASGAELTAVVLEITKSLGFDNFMHGVSLSSHPNAESHSFVFTTLPMEWVGIYDQRSFLEVDPRIQFGLDSALPYIWDQGSARGKSAATDEFLDVASQFGISSGISISLRDSHARAGITALSSSAPYIDSSRRSEIERCIPDILALGHYFHELVITEILSKRIQPTARGIPLSRRERQCLSLAAHGMTSTDIGFKLGITERTANFHFTNIISKLGVLNRKEAVAKAVARGIINVEA